MSGVAAIISSNSSSVATKCADVVLTPSSGTTPLTVHLSCATAGAHIFYTVETSLSDFPDPVTPTHTGDVATGSTVRIGTNSGNVNTGGAYCTLSAIAYEPTHLDSDQSDGSYEGVAP